MNETVLWPGVVRERIGIKVAADIAADVQEQLAPVSKALPWARVQRLLGNVPLDELQVFWAWAHPPFGDVGPADLDIQFAAWTTAKLGSSVHARRHRQLRAISLLSRAVEPLQLALVRGTSGSPDVECGADSRDGSFLRWPGRRLAACFAEGYFVLLGVLNLVGVLSSRRPGRAKQWLNRRLSRRCGGAVCGRDPFEASHLLHDSELVTKLVCQEEPMDRAGMDRLFGVGRWRPMPFIALHQGHKDRLIADGRRGGHNEHTHEQEALLLPSVDFVAFAVRSVVFIQNEWGPSATEIQGNSLCMPDWFEARLQTDDMLDAFRQLPVLPAHRTVNTTMWHDTGARAFHFAVVRGMVFGRSSAVNAFCRFPTFAVALERRVGRFHHS